MKKHCRSISISLLIIGLGLGLGARSSLGYSKDTLRISMYTRISTMDPWNHSERPGWWVADAIYDRLYDIDPETRKLTPNLAISHKIINDTTWEFELRKGVKFTNGEPFNAEVVKFAFDRVLAPERKLYTKPTWDRVIDRVEIVDEYTVRIITKKPDPILLNRLAFYGYMVPPRYIKEKGDAYFGEHPIGTGHFKLVHWKRGEEILLEANKDYWGKAPVLNKLVFRKIPEAAVYMAEFKTGGIDVIPRLEADEVPTLEKMEHAKVYTASTARIYFAQFDGDGRAGSTPFQNVKVRRAVYHAVDRQAIIKEVKRGYGEFTSGPLSKAYFGYDPTVANIEPKYNPEEAKKLLAEAGYPNGFEAEVSGYTEKTVVEAVQGYLLKVGIKTRLNWYGADQGTLIRLRNAGKVKDLAMYSYGTNIFDPDIILPYWLHSTAAPCYNKRKELDEWLDAAGGTFDAKKREELYSKAQHYIVENALWLPIFADIALSGIHKDLNFVAVGEFPQFHKCSWK